MTVSCASRPIVLAAVLAAACARPQPVNTLSVPVPPASLSVTLATPSPAVSAPSPQTAAVDFERDVRPILLRRCTPCHEPGGRMYARLPFDDPNTLRAHPEGVLRRIKEPAEHQVLTAFLGEAKPPTDTPAPH